jgi:hypothetical protein
VEISTDVSNFTPLISHYIHINIGSENHVITFTHDKCFVLTGIGQRRSEENTTLGRKGKGSSVIIPTILGTSLCDLSIVHGLVCCRFCFWMTKENAISYPKDAPPFCFIALMTSHSNSEILKFVRSPKSPLVKVNGSRLFYNLPLNILDHTSQDRFWKALRNTTYF